MERELFCQLNKGTKFDSKRCGEENWNLFRNGRRASSTTLRTRTTKRIQVDAVEIPADLDFFAQDVVPSTPKEDENKKVKIKKKEKKQKKEKKKKKRKRRKKKRKSRLRRIASTSSTQSPRIIHKGGGRGRR